jgi:hypothetical protein
MMQIETSRNEERAAVGQDIRVPRQSPAIDTRTQRMAERQAAAINPFNLTMALLST